MAATTFRTVAEQVSEMNSVYNRAMEKANGLPKRDVEDLGRAVASLIPGSTSPNFYVQLLHDIRGVYNRRFIAGASAPVPAPEPRKASEPFVPTTARPSLDLSTFVGTFTVVDGDDYETIRIKAGTGNFEGKFVASYLSGSDNETDYTGFAFIGTDGSVNVWKKFKTAEGKVSPAMASKVLAVSVVLFGGADDAREAYAMRSGRCSRCNRKLTVPASLHRGMGPECAKM